MNYNVKNLTTSDLIDKCSKNDPLAWAEFVRRFSPLIIFSIKKTLSKYAANPSAVKEDVKDIQQNILISLWNKNRLGEIKNRDTIAYWLVITVRNITIDHLRKKRKEVLIADETYFEKLPDKAPEKDISKAEFEIMNKKIKQIHNLLSTREKIIFRLYFKKQLNLKGVSKIMDIPVGTVSSIVTRIRQKIRSKI